MANHTKKNVCQISTPFTVLLTFLLITFVTGTTSAKPLYLIADINGNPTPIQVYDIAADGTLTFRAEHDIPRYGIGAVGITIDSNSQSLFVTYEDSSNIQLIDAITMANLGVTNVEGAENLAGIVFDNNKKRLYCADRLTGMLYVYDWDAITATLTKVHGSPFALVTDTAFGIALDSVNDLLYVANNSTYIRAYRTSDWSRARTIPISHNCVGIAIDDTRDLLYFGGKYSVSNDYYLTQYNLATGTEAAIQVEPDAGVFGIAVDPATGFVYISTGRNNAPGGDNLQVYDTALNQIDVVPITGNPTGLAIPTKDITYNPLQLSKNIVGSETGEVENVPIGGTIVYNICFNNKDNQHSVTNVSIVDTLPEELSFITADSDGKFGQYDPDTHTYTWTYPSLPPDSKEICFKLAAQVNQDATPGTTVTNSAIIQSDGTAPVIASVNATIAKEVIGYNPLNLSKNIIKGAVEQDVGSKSERIVAGDTIIYGICFDNMENDYTVTNVSIVDTLPDEVSFIMADGDGKFGQYDPITHTYTWSYSSLPSGFQSTCLQLVVQVNQGVAPGTTFMNSVTIDSVETEPAIASIDVTTAKEDISYNPLNLSKNIIKCAAEECTDSNDECVAAGDTIIYIICFDNKGNNYNVSNVSIVDSLPEEVSFVTADGDGVFGQYDIATHTYIWSYSSLPAGFPGACLNLVAQVNQGVAPGTMITNSATIDSVETGQATASAETVTCESPYKPSIAHWKMDDNAANGIVIDSSGMYNNGIAQRHTAFMSVPGTINGALNFNGTSDYIIVADRDEWTFSGDFTISLWVKFNAFCPLWNYFIGQDEGPNERNKWILSYLSRDKQTAFHINGPNPYPLGGYTIRGNTWAAQTGTWYFIAMTRKGSTYTFYRQGSFDGSAVNTVQIPNATAPLTIGWAERAEFLSGALDDIRIYTEALSEKEIAELYIEGLTASLIFP
jgi:uncharacterized repeat protein (TIGR01451 family)/fimbrial isopeptide formation D2 family protein